MRYGFRHSFLEGCLLPCEIVTIIFGLYPKMRGFQQHLSPMYKNLKCLQELSHVTLPRALRILLWPFLTCVVIVLLLSSCPSPLQVSACEYLYCILVLPDVQDQPSLVQLL